MVRNMTSDLNEWINGYEEMLEKEEIGKPVEWITFTGAEMNTEY